MRYRIRKINNDHIIIWAGNRGMSIISAQMMGLFNESLREAIKAKRTLIQQSKALNKEGEK